MGVGKAGIVRAVVPLALVALPCMAQGGEWFPCGNVGQLVNCQLQAYPVTKYEYGIWYNVQAPVPVNCSTWDVGFRIYNKDPYFVDSNNPQVGLRWGGFVFYTGTYATDDDECQSGTWRHRYWFSGANNMVVTSWSNGCINQPLYCRVR